MTVTEEMQKAMQADRENGMSVDAIARKYGISSATVRIFTDSFEEAFGEKWNAARKKVKNNCNKKEDGSPQRSSQGIINHYMRSEDPIWPYETSLRKSAMYIGEKMALPVKGYHGSVKEDVSMEECEVEELSTNLASFRRPNGLKITFTYAELCQMVREENRENGKKT